MGTGTKTGTTGRAKRRENSGSPDLHLADSHDLIRVHGARVNNLKNVDIEIPKRRLTVFTGVSGSGKSSLARLLDATVGRLHRMPLKLQRSEGVGAIIARPRPRATRPPSSAGGRTARGAWRTTASRWKRHGKGWGQMASC